MNTIAITSGEFLPAETNPVAAYLASLASPDSRRTQGSMIRQLAKLLGHSDPTMVPWHELRVEHTDAIKAKLLNSGLSPNTVNARLAALRGILKSARRLRLMSADDYQLAVDIGIAKGTRNPAGRALSPDDYNTLVQYAVDQQDDIVAARDAALLAVTLGGGLRRAEASSLTMADYDRDGGKVTVIGKGNKQRTVPMLQGSPLLIEKWLVHRGTKPGPLLKPVVNGKIVDRGLSHQAIAKRVQVLALKAGIGKLTPHDLRRTFGTALLEEGDHDLNVVRRMMGHSSTATTEKYDRRGDRAAEQAAAQVVIYEE